MKKLLMLVAVLLVVALDVQGATVVLRGGKQLQVDSYTQDGSYLVLHLAGGRQVTYPVSAVDMEATRAAAGPVAPAPQPSVPSGPVSPFSNAMAKEGSAGLVVTDQDVAHVQKGEPVEPGKEGAPAPPRARVVLINYEKTPVNENEWQIVATLANQGDAAADGISVAMLAMNDKGASVGSATGMVLGRLEPGQQGQATARMAVTGTIIQVTFDCSFQSIIPPPTTAVEAPAPVAKPAPQPSPASPLAPVNPMDAKRVNSPNSPPGQVQR